MHEHINNIIESTHLVRTSYSQLRHASSVEMGILAPNALIDPDLCTSCRISRSRLMDHSTTSWY